MRLKNGNELLIKQANESMVDDILAYMEVIGGESHNLTFGAHEFKITREEELAMIAHAASTDGCYFLCGYLDNELVSLLNLQRFAKKRMAHRAGIGLSVRKHQWCNGIGRAMLEEAIRYAISIDDLDFIDLEVLDDNVGAIHMYEVLGFKRYATYDHFFKLDETYYDALYMRLDVRKHVAEL